MKILLTGAFGNVGKSTLEALLARGKDVRCFDVPTRHNKKAAQPYLGRAEIVWGDLRSPGDVARAVAGCEAVIHLAFVIPKLSVTGVNCEERPEWARGINVGGTRNLLDAMLAQPVAPRLVLASSLHIYGYTQHLPPPRTIDDTPHPVEHYAHHKVEVEAMVRESGLPWAILRLAATLPVQLIFDPGMFDVPLENRIEFLHTRDAGEAFARAVDHPDVWGKTLLIGGGPRCQLYYRDMMTQVLDAMGIGRLPDWAFSRQPFAVDWLDTRESQALLGYQAHTFQDYTHDLRERLGGLRWWIRATQPIVRQYLLDQSPYAPKGTAR